VTQKLHGVEAQEFARENLRQFLVNSETWEVFWWRPEPFELWLETFPHSEAHGGGPQDLTPAAPLELEQKLSAYSGWDAPDVDPAVHFLIDRWCERRALSPLRYILNGWPHNGLTDGVAQLRDALDKIRAFARDDLTPAEAELVHLLINRVDRALSER
jgi:hypothetical protein